MWFGNRKLRANLWSLLCHFLMNNSCSADQNLVFLYILQQFIWQTGHLVEKTKKKEKNKGFKIKELICIKRLICLKGTTALSWLNGVTYSGDCWELLVRKLLVEVRAVCCWSTELNEEEYRKGCLTSFKAPKAILTCIWNCTRGLVKHLNSSLGNLPKFSQQNSDRYSKSHLSNLCEYFWISKLCTETGYLWVPDFSAGNVL